MELHFYSVENAEEEFCTNVAPIRDLQMPNGDQARVSAEPHAIWTVSSFRDPMNAWASTHPRWLDRIAYVQASSHFNAHTKQSPEISEHVLKTCNDGQALLQAYHAPSEGPISLERSSLEVPHGRAKERYRRPGVCK